MAVQQVFRATNVVVPVAPPVFFAPDSTGIVVPAGGSGWNCVVDSAGYTPGSSATFTVQFERSGVWKDDIQAIGFTLGPYSRGFLVTAVTNTNHPTITTNKPHTLQAGDSVIIAGVLGAVGVNGTWSVLAAPSTTTFTINTGAPGVYTSGGTIDATVTINNFGSSSIGTQGDAYPDNIRLRVDSVPSGTLAAITLNLI